MVAVSYWKIAFFSFSYDKKCNTFAKIKPINVVDT